MYLYTCDIMSLNSKELTLIRNAVHEFQVGHAALSDAIIEAMKGNKQNAIMLAKSSQNDMAKFEQEFLAAEVLQIRKDMIDEKKEFGNATRRRPSQLTKKRTRSTVKTRKK
jgi:hypothetical protein